MLVIFYVYFYLFPSLECNLCTGQSHIYVLNICNKVARFSKENYWFPS